MDLHQHPLSCAFPAIPESDLNDMAADIKAHGLHSAVVLYKSMVLDGWHRYLACRRVGVKPRTIEYAGNDPVGFVRSANWHRRHLTPGQRALIQVRLSEWQIPGRNMTNVATPPTGGAETKSKSEPKNSVTPSSESVKSSNDMAREAQVGVRSIERAKLVEKSGNEKIKDAVLQGKMGLRRAESEISGEKPKKHEEPQAPKYTELDAAHDQIADLQERLAVSAMDATDEEKKSAEELIKSLRSEVKTLRATNHALKQRLDGCMTENADLKKLCLSQGRKLKKFEGAGNAK